MTTTQVSTILGKYGFSTGEWTTLYSATADIQLGAIGLISDNNLAVNPTTTQYYFDNANGLLYFRTYGGHAKTTKEHDTDYEVVFEGTTYYMNPVNSNIAISGVGNVSGVVSYQEISAFYNYSDSVAKHY